jgi:hypothetical protein
VEGADLRVAFGGGSARPPGARVASSVARRADLRVEPYDRRGRPRAVQSFQSDYETFVRRAEGRRAARRAAGRWSSRRTMRCTRTTS